MVENVSKKTLVAPFAREENLLEWNEVLTKFKAIFGNDVYESWIKNINLKKEYIIMLFYQLQQDLLEIG